MTQKITTLQQLQSITGIKDLSNLSENDAQRIANYINSMDKSLIEQLLSNMPNYIENTKQIVGYFHDLNQKILDSNAESTIALHKGNLVILSALRSCLEKDELDTDEKIFIVEKMLELSKRMESIDEKNKEFLLQNRQNTPSWIYFIIFIGGVFLGTKLSSKKAKVN